MYQDDSHQPMRPCGKAHAWCEVCRPEIAARMRGAGRKKGEWGPDYDPDKFARGYVPHPTKTMWERDREAHNMPMTHDNQLRDPAWPDNYEPPVLIDKGLGYRNQHNNSGRPLNLLPLEAVLEEVKATGRSFRAKELRWHFGFTSEMIRRYKKEDMVQRKWLKKPESERKAIEQKERMRVERDKVIVEMATDGVSNLQEIGQRLGVTRERARQLIAAFEQKHDILLPRPYQMRKEQKPDLSIAIHCRYCGEIREIKESEKNKWRKGFCKKHAVSQVAWGYIQAGADWYNADQNGQARLRYQYDAVRKARGKVYAKQYREHVKKDPAKYQHYLALQREATNRHLAKKKAQKQAEKVNLKPSTEEDNLLVKRFKHLFK